MWYTIVLSTILTYETKQENCTAHYTLHRRHINDGLFKQGLQGLQDYSGVVSDSLVMT